MRNLIARWHGEGLNCLLPTSRDHAAALKCIVCPTSSTTSQRVDAGVVYSETIRKDQVSVKLLPPVSRLTLFWLNVPPLILQKSYTYQVLSDPAEISEHPNTVYLVHLTQKGLL